MTVDFYINNSDNRVVNKSLTLRATLNDIFFKDDESKSTPTLELTYNVNVENSNYCYIRELGHYYYLSEPIFGKQRIFFNLTDDLLMTFKDDILNLNCIIARQENEYNTFLKDDRYPVLNYQDVNTLVFPRGFADTENVLIAING